MITELERPEAPEIVEGDNLSLLFRFNNVLYKPNQYNIGCIRVF